VLAPAPHDWARAFQRLALERLLDQERRADTGPAPIGPLVLLGLIALFAAGSSARDAWVRGDWLPVLELAMGTAVVLVASILILRRLGRRELVDPRQVQLKLSRDASLIEVRLAVIASMVVDADALRDRVDLW
jgi:hypothetical protein